MDVFFSLSGGYDRTHEARHGICRNYWESGTHVSGRIIRQVTEERLDVSFTGIYSRLVPRTRLYASSLVSPIPLARFADNLFDSHIRHPGTVRGDSYYQRIGFEQVLLVDEKTYEQSRWWR